VSLRLGMLQIARLAPKQLGESRQLVAAFLRERLNPDGGFQDRAGASDLYYTVFGLDGLVALQEELPVQQTGAYLERFGDGGCLDFVHLACLARGWATLRCTRDSPWVDRFLARVEECRSGDGGYATAPGATDGSAYAAFLAMGAYQDVGRELPAADGVLASLGRLRTADGSYGNHPGLASGVTTTTAAAVLVMRYLGATPDRDAGMWLLDRCHARGGFFASATTPVPDLLSTATALHALSALHMPIAGLVEPCLDFVDSLWTNRGGFFGTWADDAVDCEYTYYALLALGHLSVEPS
jgi:geranylgeranyl transferase type-2 subunit beta